MGKLVALNTTKDKETPAQVVAQGKRGKLVRTGASTATAVFSTSPVKANSGKKNDALISAIVATQKKAVTAKPQNAIAQSLSKGALQQQAAKNYQSKEALEKHAKEIKKPTLSQRASDTVKGAGKSYAAGFVNASGTVAESVGGTGMSEVYRRQAETLEQQIAALKKTLNDPTMTAKDIKETREAIANTEQQLGIYSGAVRSGDKTAGAVYDTADKLASSGAKDIQSAKKGLGKVGRLAVDVGAAGAQMLGDAALGAATGGGALAPMFVRSAGGSAQEARSEGASHTQQVNYGLANGALSVATEKIANVAAPFRQMFGGGVLDKAIDRAMAKMNGSAAGKAALSFLSEGGEEVLEDLVQPVLKSIYNGKSIGQNYSEVELSDVLYDGLVGGALGLIGSGAEIMQRGNGAGTQQERAGVQEANGEGNFTPAQSMRAEGVQNAETGISPLQNAAGTDTISKGAFSLKEELKSGRAREESRDNFLRRASGEGYGILEGDTIAYGYRSDKSVLGDETGARQIQKELGALGVNCEITDGTVLWNLNGISGVREIKEAVTVDGKTILINKNTDMPAKQVAGHEAFHLWKRSAAREAYIDAVEENLDYTSPAFQQYQSAISQAYLGGEADLSNAAQYNKLREELLAYISGDIHEGMNDEFLRPMFRNYDAVKAAWENLAGSQHGESSTGNSPADLPGSIGAARAGYQAPNSEPVERTSRLADSAARYSNAEGEATARSREEYNDLFRYRGQSEAESLAKADDLVYIERDGQRQFLKDADPAAYEDLTRSLEYAPAWNAQMVDAAMQIKNELQERSIRMDITEDEYTHWLTVMREHATETGRGTQAWAKYSREGNEGGQSSELSAWENLQKSRLDDTERTERFRSILMFDKSIEQAGTPEALREIILNIADERGTLNGITGRQSAALRKAAESALGSMDFSQLKQFAYESSAALSTDAWGSNAGQKLKTVQVLNMLSSPQTAMKNLAGNTTFYGIDAMSMRGAAVLDMALSKLTGTRSVAFEQSAMSRESRDAIMKAIRMSAAEITLDVDMGATGRYEQTGNRTFKASGSLAERVLSACERNMGYLLTTTDEAYKGAARSTAKGTQALIDSGKIKNAPLDYAQTQADALAKYRTFQNDSRTADAIQSVHDVLNMIAGVGDSGRKTKGKHTIHSFGLGDLAAPFTRVAGNLAGVGLDYSPVNAAKGAVEIVSAIADAAKNGANPGRQAKAVSDFARGMTGTAIAYGFMALAKAGLLKRAEDDDNKDIAELNKTEGMTGAQINLSAAKRWIGGDETGEWQYGDTLVDLSNLEPLNFMVSLGAEMAQDNSGSILTPFTATKNSLLSAAGDLPVLQTAGDFAKDVFKYGTPPEQAFIEAIGKTAVSSVTPNVIAAIAKGMDDKQRNVYSGDGTTDVLIDTLKSRIPGLRETLPTTVNTLGEEKDNAGSLTERLTRALISPIGVNQYTQSEVSKEMERVRGETGDTSFYPTTRKPDELSYKDKSGTEHTVSLDYDQKQKFQAACASGQMAYTAAMMETQHYKTADSETKAALLERCRLYSYEEAKAEVLGDSAVDAWVKHARMAQSELHMSTAEYLAGLEQYGSGMMSGTGFDKTKRMLDAGLSLADWSKMRESVDADKNGSVKKDELTSYIEAHFPKERWSALFDAYKGGQNWKNPY